MSWKNEPVRHGLASKGIKTKFKDKKNHNKMEDFEEDSKTYTFYHGTSLERANKILEEGLKKKNWSRPICLSPSKETAKEYAKTKRVGKYLTETQSRDDGVILKIKITEDDLEKEGVSPETVEARKENLRKSVKEGWDEYALYHKIPPDNIELEEYL